MSSVVISGDTSGSITLQAPAVAGSNTFTLPAATGTVMVSGNMPAFSAYANANQSVSSATWTKVTLNAKHFDTASYFDSTTNYRFTPLIAGYYMFTGNVQSYETAGTGTISICAIYKNGSEFLRGQDSRLSVAGFSTMTSSITALMYMNGSTDYVELYGYVAATSPFFSGGAGSGNISYLQGVLARTA